MMLLTARIEQNPMSLTSPPPPRVLTALSAIVETGAMARIGDYSSSSKAAVRAPVRVGSH